MSWFRRRPITPLPGEQLGRACTEDAVIAEARTLPRFPTVVADVLQGRVPLSRYALQAELEIDPVLADELKTAWRVGPLERLLSIMPPEIVFERLVEVACLRYADAMSPPLQREGRNRRHRHAVAVAGASRALAREAGADPMIAQAAFLTGAVHLIGVHALELYVRNHWTHAAERLARGDMGIEACAESVECCPWRVGGALLKERDLPDAVWRAVSGQGLRGGDASTARLRQARRCAHLAGFPPVTGDAPTQPAPAAGIAAAVEAVRHMDRLRDARMV